METCRRNATVFHWLTDGLIQLYFTRHCQAFAKKKEEKKKEVDCEIIEYEIHSLAVIQP